MTDVERGADPVDEPGTGSAADAVDDPPSDLSAYTLRAFEPGDEGAIVALHNRVWDGDRSVAWFRWKYVDTPYLDVVPVCVATHEAEIVAAFGLVPFRMRAAGETELGLLAGDLVVHPDQRRRGLFTSLFASLLDGGADWTRDETYVARRDGDPLAAVIVRETRDERLDATTVSLVHAVAHPGMAREAGIATILDRIVSDNRDADFLRAWNPVFPDHLLRERGFLSDDRPPLSWARGPDLRLVATSLSGGPFSNDALARSGPAL